MLNKTGTDADSETPAPYRLGRITYAGATSTMSLVIPIVTLAEVI